MASLPLDAFISGLIHAVNNPLTYVQTNLASLRRDLRDLTALLEACEAVVERVPVEASSEVAEVRRLRDELAMDRPAEVLAQVVGDALEGLAQVQRYLRAARAAPQALSGEPERIQGHDWLTRLVTEHRASLPPGVSFEWHDEGAHDFTGVRAHWDHILGAVLLNARDALQRAGTPGDTGRIRVTSAGAHVVMDDSGPGVPTAITDKIFLPFFTTRPGAVGLGLALAAAMAEAGGGRLELVEGLGPLGGARFSVRLPTD